MREIHDDDQSLDKPIYDHFLKQGRHCTHVLEALAQRLHDFSIDDALDDFLAGRVESDPGEKKVVALIPEPAHPPEFHSKDNSSNDAST